MPEPSTVNSPPPPPASPRRRIARVAFALAALCVAAYLGRNLFLGKPVETVEAVRADLLQTVVASGRVMSPRRVHIGAVVTGRVVRIPVAEGQSVRKGDELILLDDKDVRAAGQLGRSVGHGIDQ